MKRKRSMVLVLLCLLVLFTAGSSQVWAVDDEENAGSEGSGASAEFISEDGVKLYHGTDSRPVYWDYESRLIGLHMGLIFM